MLYRCTYIENLGTPREAKFLVFFSALMELFIVCTKCLSADCAVDIKERGTSISVTQNCSSCTFSRTWNSQPLIGSKGTPAGNLMLSASILFSGTSPSKVLRVFKFLSVPTISSRTFFRHQSQYLMPSVSTIWNKEQAVIIESAQQRNEPLIIGGDGRCDSPGHSAKFGSYTMVDMLQNKVIDLQLVQVITVT